MPIPFSAPTVFVKNVAFKTTLFLQWNITLYRPIFSLLVKFPNWHKSLEGAQIPRHLELELWTE